jgi:flagellar assembly protein FliH
VLGAVSVSRTPVPVGAPAARLPDDVLRIVEAEAAAAFERGRHEGVAQGRAQAHADAASLAAGIQAAAGRLRHDIDARRDADAQRLMAMAVEIARVVTGRDPDGLAAAMVRRITEALQAIDDASVQVFVHPDDCALVRAAGIDAVADPSLRRGDAVLRGRWAEADATSTAIWDAVREAVAVPNGLVRPLDSGTQVPTGAS